VSQGRRYPVFAECRPLLSSVPTDMPTVVGALNRASNKLFGNDPFKEFSTILHRLQEEELRLRQQQWEWEKSRDIREAEKQRTPAAQVKFFGNALKSVMPKFSTDAADIPT